MYIYTYTIMKTIWLPKVTLGKATDLGARCTLHITGINEPRVFKKVRNVM